MSTGATPSNSTTTHSYCRPYNFLGFTIDTDGAPFLSEFQLLFENTDMPILVLDLAEQPDPNVIVSAHATMYAGISETDTSNATRACTLTNLPPTHNWLVARTADNHFAAPTVRVTLQLILLHQQLLRVPSN